MARARFKSSTKEIDHGYKAMRRVIKQIQRDKPYVKVGVQADAGEHSEGTPMTLVASVHEFGAPSKNIPERSFIRSTMDEKRRFLRGLTQDEIFKIIRLKTHFRSSLDRIGLVISTLIKKKITDLRKPPLKPATIRRKGSSNPLVDTGQMRASIRHVVVEKDTGEGGDGVVSV